MKKILPVLVLLFAACASKPASSPVQVTVTPQAPVEQSQADALRDVANGLFTNYTGPARSVAITFGGPQPNAIGVDPRPRVNYVISDSSGAVIENSWTPVSDDTDFKNDPTELYRQTSRFILRRLQVTGS